MTDKETDLKRTNKSNKKKNGRKTEQTFFQERYTGGQQAQEKMFNIVNHQRNASQNYSEIAPHTCEHDHHQKDLK